MAPNGRKGQDESVPSGRHRDRHTKTTADMAREHGILGSGGGTSGILHRSAIKACNMAHDRRENTRRGFHKPGNY